MHKVGMKGKRIAWIEEEREFLVVFVKLYVVIFPMMMCHLYKNVFLPFVNGALLLEAEVNK